MIHIDATVMWPPPEDWTEVVVLWDDVLAGPKYPIKQILDWLEAAPGGKYHLHGYNSTEGFAFRFKNPRDATHFKLKWL
jgi:hypothetical protein